MLKEINEAVHFIQSKYKTPLSVGIILGSGLGSFINEIEVEFEIPYSGIPHFPVSTVEGHSGKLIFGNLSGKKIVAMAGRFHYYEGYSFQQITFPVRVMKLLGVKALLLSNAAGGVNLNYKKGDLILIDDHINLLPSNPLIGKNIDELGGRFPDMSQPYSLRLNSVIEEVAQKEGISIKKGVYASVMGPNLETRAEYRFLKTIGADLVGMSTVPEVIVANHMSMPCAAISSLSGIAQARIRTIYILNFD